MFARTRLLQITEAMKGRLVVVYGDIVADRFDCIVSDQVFEHMLDPVQPNRPYIMPMN